MRGNGVAPFIGMLFLLGSPGCQDPPADGPSPPGGDLPPLTCVPPANAMHGDPDPHYDEAAAAARKWAAAHPGGWTVAVTETDPARGFKPAYAGQRCGSIATDNVAITYEGHGVKLSLSLPCAVVLSSSTAADVQRGFRYAVLDNLPHGIRIPCWDFRVLTPVSSFSEGVEILELRDQRLSLRIQTPLYELFGHSQTPTCTPYADEASAPRCYVAQENRIPITLTLTAPVRPSDLM